MFDSLTSDFCIEHGWRINARDFIIPYIFQISMTTFLHDKEYETIYFIFVPYIYILILICIIISSLHVIQDICMIILQHIKGILNIIMVSHTVSYWNIQHI